MKGEFKAKVGFVISCTILDGGVLQLFAKVYCYDDYSYCTYDCKYCEMNNVYVFD